MEQDNDSLTIPGLFWNLNDDSEIEDGKSGKVSVWDDEIICIISSKGIEVRLTLYELRAILEFAESNITWAGEDEE